MTPDQIIGPGDDDYGRSRCKHGVVGHVRCRDCEDEPVPQEAIDAFMKSQFPNLKETT